MTTTLLTGARAETESPPLTLSGAPLLRLLAGIQRTDQLAALSRLPAGDGLVRLPVKGAPIVLVRNPQHARHILVTNQDLYAKGIDYKVLAVLLGKGLLTNFDQASWQRQRALVQPLFARRHLGPMVDHMVGAGADWLDALDRRAAGTGVPIDVSEAMMGLTLDVVARALFGASLPQRDVDAVGASMTVVLRAAAANARVIAFYRALGRLPGVQFEDLLRLRRLHWARAQRGIARIDEVVHALIDERLREGAQGSDLLSLLLSARDDAGAEMDREQVRDEVTTFLAAGHETTANALTWMWLLLSRHPEARARMEAEVDEVLGGRTPTFADADRLPWTTACLHEAMRLFPPVPAISRVSMRRDEVGGLRVPAGTVMVILPYLIHRDPQLWSNPEGFDPRRFLPGAQEGRPRQAFMPFGAGRRICVGSGFATIEGTLLAAMTAQRLRFDLVPGARIRRELAITLRPRDGMPMTVHRRDR
jgi:cytochrome P450